MKMKHKAQLFLEIVQIHPKSYLSEHSWIKYQRNYEQTKPRDKRHSYFLENFASSFSVSSPLDIITNTDNNLLFFPLSCTSKSGIDILEKVLIKVGLTFTAVSLDRGI